MKKNNGDANLVKLKAEGYGKAKAIQALKDAGGNYDLALNILRRTKELVKKRQIHIIPQPPSVTTGTEVETAESEPVVKIRKHPCIVRYKKCNFGEKCYLKDFPGDTCINHFNGNCIYGDMCIYRHAIDGIDIRKYHYLSKDHVSNEENGVFHSASDFNATQFACHASDSAGQGFSYSPQYMTAELEASCFNDTRESYPSYTDAVQMTRQNTTTSAPEHATPPPPLVEMVRQMALSPGPELSKGQGKEYSINSTEVAPLRAYTNRIKKHPCIEQLGKCRFGKNCWYTNYDSDVCIYYLMGQCRFPSGTCHYRHEMYKNTTELNEAGPATSIFIHNTNFRMHAPLKNQAEKFNNEFDDSFRTIEASTTLLHPEPLQSRFLAINTEEVSQEQVENADDDSIHDKSENHAFESNGPTDLTQDNAMAVTSEKELNSLLQLADVFPDTEPWTLLTLLRSTNGDLNEAALVVERIECMPVEDLDKVLSQALAEEEEEESAKERKEQESTNNFLTLHTLFPNVDLNTIEVVLERNNNELSEAYKTLLCSQENIPGIKYGTIWSGKLTHAETMRMEKICSMFPDIERSIISDVFGRSNKNSNDTITCLNALTSELLTFDEREARGREAMCWNPHHDTEGKACPPASPGPLPASREASHDLSTDSLPILSGLEENLHTYGDWRRIRKRSYAVNSCRIRVLSQATAAFLRRDGATAKMLSRKGRDLAAEYQRLNRLAMISLEQERLKNEPVMMLDLHGFHVEEALEVLSRRVCLCCKKRIPRLTIITGEGKHNPRGYSVVYNAVIQNLKEDPFLIARTRVVSIGRALVEVSIKFNSNSTPLPS